MKIINYVAYFLLPLAIINNNDTMALKTRVSSNAQNYNNSVDGIMKFYNYSGGNMCSLTALNQCLSALNPGNNEILKNFKQIYNNIANYKDNNNTEFAPQRVLRSVLDCLPDNNEYKKVLLYEDGVDIEERYQSLISISEMFKDDILKINSYTRIYPDEKACDTLREEIIRQNEQAKKDSLGKSGVNYNDAMNLVLQFDSMNLFNKYKNEIKKASDIIIDNNPFSLSSVAFRTISRRDAELNNNMSQQGDQRAYYDNKSYTHFVSAKKLPDGRWVLLNSSSPNNIRAYKSFESLMNSLGNRYLPRLVFFSKPQNNNENNNNNRLRNNNKNRKIAVNNNEINKNNKKNSININEHNITKHKGTISINMNEYDINKNNKKNNININEHNISKHKDTISININEYNINENKGKKNINVNEYDNNIKKNKQIENNKEQTRINKLKIDIDNAKKQKDDIIALLKVCLKEDKREVNNSLNIINSLYHNREMRQLVMTNIESDEIYDFLCNLKCGYLNNYKELIRDMFNKHAELKSLKTELSKIERN